MSTPILPFAVWEEGTNQNSIPANDNSLRNQILNGLVISDSTDAQPGSPSDGDIYIMTGAATGSQWATFDEFDLAIYMGGTWYSFAPVEGVVVNLAGSLKRWDGAAYVSVGGGGGGVSGPGSSTDNALSRWDGAGGDTLQDSGVLVTDNSEISGYRGHINRQTGTTYTLVDADSGKIVELANSSAITLTLPNSLAAGFCCTVVQDGAGQVTVSASSGATVKNRQSHTKLAGNGAFGTLYVSSNAGSAAAYRFGGDTAA